MSPQSGHRSHRPSGMPLSLGSLESLRLSLGSCDIRGGFCPQCSRCTLWLVIFLLLRVFVPSWLADFFAEFCDGRGSVGVVEDGAGNDEPIDAGVAGGADGLGVEAAVHLEALVGGEA